MSPDERLKEDLQLEQLQLELQAKCARARRAQGHHGPAGPQRAALESIDAALDEDLARVVGPAAPPPVARLRERVAAVVAAGPPPRVPAPSKAPATEIAIEHAPAASCRKAEHKALRRHCAAKGYDCHDASVLSVLWHYLGNEEGDATCYPKVETIAEEACLSVSTAQRSLRRLVARGEVWIARPARGAGGAPSALRLGDKPLPAGQNVYLLTRYAAPETLRAWARAGLAGLRVDGAGQAPYSAPEAVSLTSTHRSA